MISPALAFNDAINAQDLEGLSALMTGDHVFINSEGGTVRGKDAARDAWRGFFKAFPDYRNIIESSHTKEETVVLTGRSDCSEPALHGPALWTAKVNGGLVAEWRVYDDTPENRAALGLAAAP